MRSMSIQTGVWAVKRALSLVVITFIALLVGAGCVLFPQALPSAILGLAGLLLLWVMPDLQRVPVRLAGSMLIPFIVSILSIPAYYAIVLPGIPWLSIRRVIFFAFAFSVVVTIAGSEAHRRVLIQRLKATPVLSGLAGIYFSITLLAAFTSSRIGVSIGSAVNVMLFELIPLLGIIIIVNSERKIKMIFIACVICVIFDVVLGAIEYRLHRPFLIYALPQAVREQLVARAAGYAGLMGEATLRNGAVRAASVFLVPLSWGEMAAMVSPIAAFFAAFGKTRRVRTLGFLSIAACFASVFFSGSRGAYVGFIAAALMFWLAFVFRLVKTNPGSLIGPIALCMCAILSVVTLSSVFFVARVHRAVLGGAEVQSSDDGRSQQWALAKPKILARPVLGYGPGTSTEIVGWTSAAGDPSLDSYVITLLVGIGIPGCIAFFAMLIAAAMRCFLRFLADGSEINAYGLSLGCALVSFGLYRLTLSQTENNTMMFVLLGLVVSLATLAKQPSVASRKSLGSSFDRNPA